MNLQFDKARWEKDKLDFIDTVEINVELMDKVKHYFFSFMRSPIVYYDNKSVEAKIYDFNNEDELISYLEEQYNNGVKMALYCILIDNKNDMLRLRSAIL